MKKLLALMLTLAMLACAAACAETVESTEADVSAELPVIDTTGWSEVQLTDINVHFYVPSDMEVCDPDPESGEIWYAENADLAISVSMISGENSIEDIDAELADAGCSVNDTNVLEMSCDHQEISSTSDDTYGAVLIQGTDGNYYLFECYDLTAIEGETFGEAPGACYFAAAMSTLSDMQ